MSSQESGDIVIIGCGISGLSAAYHLLLNGFGGRIIILESRSTIGGRIRSTATKYESHRIELGANWIHGIMGNPIYELAIKHKLIDPLSISGGKHLVEARTLDGNKIDIKLVEEVYRTYFYFIKKCEHYFQIDDCDDVIRHENSVGKYLSASIDLWIDMLKDVTAEDKQLRKAIFETLINRETCISGCHSMDEVSLKDFGSYTELPGGNTTIPKGFNQVLNCLLAEISERAASKSKLGDKSNLMDGKQLTILKSHRVCQIKWKGVSSAHKRVQVICENGSTFECDHVVVTLPLGVLKKEADRLFEPNLPTYKLEAINSLGFGVVDKIFLEYSLPLNNFIDVNVDETIVLWDNENQPIGKWFKKIYSISKITNHCLLLWASGEEALKLEELSEEEINEELTQLLQQFFGNKKFPKADNVIVTRWGADPHSRGSYTFIPSKSSVVDIERLSQPIYADPAHDKVNDFYPTVAYFCHFDIKA